eukprot:TRINITY_DN278_c0_g1_i12.p1 TRINITY_DN278_c0_g1~~TRINITY_DN278_c0_g1_i12.p1  ORF type:complete len:172 (+),score=15.63 TRINITY_DN278_c0_g1_i12:206-721(+)
MASLIIPTLRKVGLGLGHKQHLSNRVIETRLKTHLEVRMLEVMKKEELRISTRNYVVLFGHLDGKIEIVEELWEMMKLQGKELNVYVIGSLIHQFGKAGKMEQVKNIVERMKELNIEHNAITMNSLIHAYGKAEMAKKVEEMKFDEVNRLRNGMARLNITLRPGLIFACFI